MHVRRLLLPALVLCMGCSAAPFVAPSSATYPTTTAPIAPGGATDIYVGQSPNNPQGQPLTISDFPAASNGTAAPSTTITVPYGNFVYAVATDRAGQIYVSANDEFAILVYPPGATATTAPVNSILGGAGSFVAAQFLGVDAIGQVYVYDCCVFNTATSMYENGPGVIDVFAPGASGAAVPVRSITGPLTQLGDTSTNTIYGMAVDPSGTIYIADSITDGGPIGSGSILAFAPGASGNVAPSRIITNIQKTIPNRTPNYLYITGVSALATDASSNLYAATSTDTAPYEYNIVEFAPTANGIATPLKLIAGSSTGLNSLPTGLAVDKAGNIFVTQSGPSATISVEAFGASGADNLQPALQFTSPQFIPLSGHNGQLAVH
jgi:hypothetical protein